MPIFGGQNKRAKPDKGERSLSLTCLSEGSVLVGDFMTGSNIRVECDVKGKIVTSGRLVISERAHIDGNVKCGSALVLGLVKGNIVSSGVVSLKLPAKVQGNILAADIHIEKGVVVSGMYKIARSSDGTTTDAEV